MIDRLYYENISCIGIQRFFLFSQVQTFNNWPSLENDLHRFRDGMLSIENPLASDANISEGNRGEETTDGAGVLLGMNNDEKGRFNSSDSGKENSSTGYLTFDNSSSSNNSPDVDNLLSDNQYLNDSTSSTAVAIQKTPTSIFKLPSTPSPIFSKKNMQAGKRAEKPNMIASMFARQMQKNSPTSSSEFEPSQVAFGLEALDVPEDVSDSTSGQSQNRVKRPRQKKMKL